MPASYVLQRPLLAEADSAYILATIWRGSVHEVIYQTPLSFFWSRLKRNRELFKFYDDGQVRALYSKVMDFMTFMTTDFDDHRTDIRWKGRLD